MCGDGRSLGVPFPPRFNQPRRHQPTPPTAMSLSLSPLPSLQVSPPAQSMRQADAIVMVEEDMPDFII